MTPTSTNSTGFTLSLSQDEKQFLLLELPSLRPLAFVQSIRTPDLCFITLPAQVVEPGYQLNLQPADIEALGYTQAQPPRMGQELLCLAPLGVGAAFQEVQHGRGHRQVSLAQPGRELASVRASARGADDRLGARSTSSLA